MPQNIRLLRTVLCFCEHLVVDPYRSSLHLIGSDFQHIHNDLDCMALKQKNLSSRGMMPKTFEIFVQTAVRVVISLCASVPRWTQHDN